MGFSLAGFGAGVAEGMLERIEEERKFSSAALQGRIERASVLKLQQEKQAREMEEELRSRRDELIQLGVTDPEDQKAYLFSPLAFDALKKAKTSTDEDIRAINPKTLISANKERLATMTGTVDDVIRNAVRPQQQVDPAKLLEPAGKPSFFAPSAESQRTRFGQLAAARGLTLEDVARAESGAGPKMPEPVGQINFEAFPKKPEKQPTPEQMLSKLEADALRLATEKGEDHPEARAAKNKFINTRVIRENWTKDQFDHAKMLSKAQAIVDGNLPVSPQERKDAEDFLRRYEERRKRNRDKDPTAADDKVPSSNALISSARSGGASAVNATFGTAKGQIAFITNADGSTTSKYSGDDPVLQRQILRKQQEGAINTLSPYLLRNKDGSYSLRDNDPKIEVAVRAFAIDVDPNTRRLILADAPPLAETKKPPPTLPPATPASSAAPAPAASAPTRTPGPGRAGQGAAAAAPAAAPRTATKDKFEVNKEYEDADGNRAIYLGNGQWKPVTKPVR